jgi:two-component system response regulator YesN
MKRLIQTSMTVGVGSCVHHINDISYSYDIAMEAVKQKMFLGNNQIITVDDMEAERNNDLRRIHNKVDAIPSLLKTGTEEKVIEYLNALFDELTTYRSMSQHYCRVIAIQVVSGASHFLMEYEMGTRELEEQEQSLWEELFSFETIHDIKLALGDYLLQVCRTVGEKRTKKSHEAIERIKRIINDKYQENLTITEIANQVFFSSTYICLLFKQETGETINDYMTKFRMEKAKELLVNTEHKLHDISLMIGYVEPSYFSKQFKRLVGFSPSEYREIYSHPSS